MAEQVWRQGRSKTVICLDSYRDGVPEGRIYDPQLGVESFKSLSQFLIKMESMLDHIQMPQSYNATRTFPTVTEPLKQTIPPIHIRRGAKATFEVQVLFRQHTSWQGVVVWLEAQLEQSFRSVLELIMLMDSALRGSERSDAS